ncbi:MAG: hypothetical protein RL291_840 [Pseudomonadota bacterium]|jgi:hypothetical protein
MWTTIFLFLLLLVVLGAGYIFLRSVQSGQSVTDWLFAPKPDKRLGVLELTPVDGRRRLVLVRRDDVEHLIMIGGPVDVVIETNIGTPQVANTARLRNMNGASQSTAAEHHAPPTFGRQARTINQTPQSSE